MKKLTTFLLLTTFCAFTFGQDLEPEAPGSIINLTPANVTILNSPPSAGDEGQKLMPIGSKLLFIGQDAAYGDELWITDGTEEGTELLKDINSGTGGSSATNFTAVGDKVYFSANDGTNGSELWVTDGTNGGTIMLKDVFMGESSSNPSMLTNFNVKLLFMAEDLFSSFAQSRYLWISDGTAEGTLTLKSSNDDGVICREDGDSKYKLIQIVGDKAFFVANDGTYGNELWVTDGTSANTKMVLDIGTASDGEGGTVGSKIEWQFNANGSQLLFRAETPVEWGINPPAGLNSYGEELWVTDGTVEGTYFLGDYCKLFTEDPVDKNKTDGTQYAFPQRYAGKVYFRAKSNDAGATANPNDVELHYTTLIEGTVEGQADLNYVANYNGYNDNGQSIPSWLQPNFVFDSLLMFTMWNNKKGGDYDTVWGRELFYLDEFAGQPNPMPQLVYDFAPGGGNGIQSQEFEISNSKLYFEAAQNGDESDKALWCLQKRSDDATQTPYPVYNEAGNARYKGLTDAKGVLYFLTELNGVKELYCYNDGTPVKEEKYVDYAQHGPNEIVGPVSLPATEMNEVSYITVSPNPASDFIQVELNNGIEKAKIMVIDTRGCVAMSKEVFKHTTLDVSHLASGNYILMVNTEHGTIQNKKIIINR